MLIDILKMPNMFQTVGLFYTVLVVFIMLNSILTGYWHGIFGRLITILLNNKLITGCYLLVIFCLILFVDQQVSSWCHNYYNFYLYTILDFFSSMGEGWFVVGLFTTIMLIANLFNSKYLAKVFEVAAVIAIYSGLFNMVFKFVFNRERPSIGSGNPFHFFQFILSKDHQLIDLTYACNSMPSGHTITIASSLTVLFLSFKNKLIKSICIFFMLIIPLSRVYTINHWFSDIFTSFVIGSIFGYIIYDIHLSNNEIIF